MVLWVWGLCGAGGLWVNCEWLRVWDLWVGVQVGVYACGVCGRYAGFVGTVGVWGGCG